MTVIKKLGDNQEIHSMDQRLADCANEVSDAVHKALERGVDVDVICSVLVGVAADYWLEAGYPISVTTLGNILVHEAAQRAPGGSA